jgi:hypothetical protein
MRVKIGRTIIAAVVIEAITIALLFVLVALFGPNDAAAAQAYAERLGQWVGPIGGAVFCFLGGWWLTRNLSSGQVLNALILGAVVALIDIALLILSTAPYRIVFVVSNCGRLAAAAVGGWLAEALHKRMAQE